MVANGVYQIVTPEWGHGAKKIPKDLDNKRRSRRAFSSKTECPQDRPQKKSKKLAEMIFR
jgi:hypothetical protein